MSSGFRSSPSSRKWSDVTVNSVGVNCSKISATECDFTRTGLSGGFLRYFNVSLRVRAELPGRVSAWASAPWFQHYRNGKCRAEPSAGPPRPSPPSCVAPRASGPASHLNHQQRGGRPGTPRSWL